MTGKKNETNEVSEKGREKKNLEYCDSPNKDRNIHMVWMAKKPEVLGQALWSQIHAVPYAHPTQRIAERMM